MDLGWGVFVISRTFNNRMKGLVRKLERAADIVGSCIERVIGGLSANMRSYDPASL